MRLDIQKKLIGSHLSIAGGHANALKNAKTIGLHSVAIFTASPRVWKRPELNTVDNKLFSNTRSEMSILHIVGHALYLANPGSPQHDLSRKSINAVSQDLKICHTLGIPWLVIHPGSNPENNLTSCIKRIAENLDHALELAGTCSTGLALETTAGAGKSVGGQFEHIRDILAASRYPERYGVCIDTCHIFAAGYDFRCAETWSRTRESLNRAIGFNRVRCIHLNDSKGELGSNKDRHEHIGMGQIGDSGFHQILTDPSLQGIPLILETPKNPDHSLDIMNKERVIHLMKIPELDSLSG